MQDPQGEMYSVPIGTQLLRMSIFRQECVLRQKQYKRIIREMVVCWVMARKKWSRGFFIHVVREGLFEEKKSERGHVRDISYW